MKLSNTCSIIAFSVALFMANSVFAKPNDFYTMADFAKIKKIDAHVHANSASHYFVDQARKDNFEILSINVDYPDFPPIDTQYEISQDLLKYAPRTFHFAATFSMDNYADKDWAIKVNQRIDEQVKHGAIGVKIWKNVGMVERDKDGKLLMLDNPLFEPIVKNIKNNNVTLIVHAGEPHNCWLPLDKMTNDNDREYFRDHPDYHMALHPEMPSYEEQMRVRDNFLAHHPEIKFAGAHMASLEWSVDKLAEFLDKYPNARVDLAARMTEVQYQSVRDYKKVRNFFIKYQNRLMYGTDLTTEADDSPSNKAQNPPIDVSGDFSKTAHNVWQNDWKYLATSNVQNVAQIHANVKGLQLPKSVINKIYYANAKSQFLSNR